MSKSGMELLETMIVVFIIGALAAIAIPSFIKAKTEFDRKQKVKELQESLLVHVSPNYMGVTTSKIPTKSALEILAIGSCDSFIVYKVIDTVEDKPNKFYVVLSSNCPPQTISLEKPE